jgi:electron transport complex protein RnfB
LSNFKIPSDPPKKAVIREAECIGCTKCIQACPFDAIMGASKWMHTVITDLCTGCELCVVPCPMDCIDIVTLPEKSATEKQLFLEKSRVRFDARNTRLATDKVRDREKHLQQKQADGKNKTIDERKAQIALIIQRRSAKKE